MDLHSAADSPGQSDLIPINKIVLPGGKRLARATLYRWARNGVSCNGHVPLRLFKVGGATYVRQSDLTTFIDQCNGGAQCRVAAQVTPPRSEPVRKAASDQAIALLAAEGARILAYRVAGRNPRRNKGFA